MKIKQIRAIPLKYVLPEGKAYGMSKGLSSQRVCTLVEVESDDGLVGIGEAWGDPDVIIKYLKMFSHLFIGEDPRAINDLKNKVINGMYHLGWKGLHISAFSGIEIALWDLVGKYYQAPISHLLGGKPKMVKAYASTGYLGDLSLKEQIASFLKEDFSAIKIKIGTHPEEDADRIAETRNAVGPDILIMADVNGNYTVDQVIKSVEMIQEYDIYWLEEPLPPYDVEGLRILRQKINIPISVGEALYTRFDFKSLISEKLVDIIQPDICLGGGISEGFLICQMAQTWNIRISPHVWGSAVGLVANLHLISALSDSPHTNHIPDPMMVEFDLGENPLRTELLAKPLNIRKGYIATPNKPGLGIELNQDTIKKFSDEVSVFK